MIFDNTKSRIKKNKTKIVLQTILFSLNDVRIYLSRTYLELKNNECMIPNWSSLRPATLIKRDSGTVVFLWILRIC